MAIEFRQQEDCFFFMITVRSEKDARKLEVSNVLYRFGKNNKDVQVPFTKMKPRFFYEINIALVQFNKIMALG